MNINQEEAKILLSWASVVDLEVGLEGENKLLYDKIRSNFKTIDVQMSRSEERRRIWGVDAEEDPEVKATRKEMTIALQDYTEEALREVQNKFDEIKARVFDRILEERDLL